MECSQCKGCGWVPLCEDHKRQDCEQCEPDWQKCPTCGGKGVVLVNVGNSLFKQSGVIKPCSKCRKLKSDTEYAPVFKKYLCNECRSSMFAGLAFSRLKEAPPVEVEKHEDPPLTAEEFFTT